ncbi:radiation sensitive protein rad9 [Parahypoxylon ruwenzoriense]
MAPKATKRSLRAEQQAIPSEIESQDSQAFFGKLLVEHGLGVHSSSQLASAEPAHHLSGKSASLRSSSRLVEIEMNIPSSPMGPGEALNSIEDGTDLNASCKKPQNALIACGKLDATSSSLKKPSQSAALRSNSQDATSVDDAASQIPPSSSPLKKKTKKKGGEMSSGSPTQSNDGRSYEQYVDNNSQPQSSQASSVHEHRTLHEDDTGFLNFKRTHHDIPESIPEEDDVNITDEVHTRSQPTSQAPWTNNHYAAAPETPAISREFFQVSNEELIAPSQLFGQTQWTSAIKKVSPTSSRPSPNIFNQNTISPNLIASSPLKNKGLRTSPTRAPTSSPAFPGISSRPSDEKTPSGPVNSHEDEDHSGGGVTGIPSTRVHAPRSRTTLEPIGEYEPLRQRSPGTDASKSPSKSGGEHDSDSEADAVAYRRRLARLKQEKASKSFPSISLPRSNSNKGSSVEVPSTSRTKPNQYRNRTKSEQYLAQCYGKDVTDNNESQETVADSQEAAPAPPRRTETTLEACDEADESSVNDAGNTRVPDPSKPRVPASNVEYRETIPETSPPSTSIGLPKLVGDIMGQESSARSGMETVSFPTLSSDRGFEQQQKVSGEPRSSSQPEQLPSISRSRKRQFGRSRSALDSSPSVVLASTPQSRTQRSVELGNMATPSSTSPELRVPSDPCTATSTLTTLSATPNISSSTTPNTDVCYIPDGNERQSPFPAVAEVERRERLSSAVPEPSPLLPRIKVPPRSRESLRRTTRRSSISTDELVKSPTSTFSKEERKAPIRKPGRKSLANQHLLREPAMRGGIFEGMVFALSFQSGQVRRGNQKHADRTAIERMICQEGGRILSGGFDELFKFDSFPATGSTPSAHVLSSSLRLLNQDTGFTALIADGHSRKVKYMQALALGIPCLAPRWIMNCIAKREIVDWSSYLLCAGPSTLLGDAIRSRNLQPYDASTAKLADVMSNRPRMLDGARILLVMKNTKNEEKRLPYVFLAQILGGSLVRVHTVDEARAKLLEKESQGQAFDWVYADDRLRDAQKALFGPSTGDTVLKKRKKRSTEEPDRPPKRIRTLNDELVIQSLILGRLIEDEEMEE